MHVHAIALPARYLQVPHEILRHPRLNGTAKALLQWALSLPPGSRETLQTIGEKMPEGRIAVTKARRQLLDEGYLHIRRRQSRLGTWSTAVLVSNTPLLAPEDVAAAWASSAGDDEAGPADSLLTVGGLDGQAVGSSPKGENTEGNTSLPASLPAAPEPVGEDAEAAAALVRAVLGEPRLRLGVGETAQLAPLVAEWLARGATERELRAAVVEGLPARIHSPSALLRNRLERKMPPPPPPPVPTRRRHECARCEAPGLDTPGICRPCAGLGPTMSPSRAAAAAARGAAAVRAATGWPKPALVQ